MNQLNQILIEGTVQGAPIDCSTTSEAVCEFWLLNHRTAKLDPTMEVDENIIVRIRTHGDLARNCHREVANGRGIRIIGRLAIESAGMFIVADHVIYKPVCSR